MAGDIINLRQARKQRDRLKKEAEAAENRRKFGQTRSERELTQARQDKARVHLDGHHLGDSGDAAEPEGAADKAPDNSPDT
ncbi:DUF4169 family protein [Pannonibacter sp.]|uniref:DUF4169 family protein n=1 Tax=Pannonibacter sp. TaxID=1906786 RepID=UPI003F6E9807